jgi:hypothetical protein
LVLIELLGEPETGIVVSFGASFWISTRLPWTERCVTWPFLPYLPNP